jgi:signal transduction histidine kinase
VVLEQVRMLEHAHLKSAVVEAQALLETARQAGDSDQRTLYLQETAHSLNRLRRLITELHGHLSQAAQDDGTTAALPNDLERTLREVTENYRTLVARCTLEAVGVPAQPIPANVRAALVMGLYNALTNAHIHGHAQAVRVRLEYRLADITLTIHDTGCGFDVARARAQARGRGIRDLFTLTEQQGGSVTITSVLGQGTDVTITLPLVRPELGWAGAGRPATPATPAQTTLEVLHATARTTSSLAAQHASAGARHSDRRRHGDRAGANPRSADPPWLSHDRGRER